VDETTQNITLLERSELFEGLDLSVCTYMASTARFRGYQSRDSIFVAGDLIREVLLLVDGLVKLTLSGEEGTEVIIRLCLPGEVVYAPAIVPESRYFLTAETMQACRVAAWDGRTFEAAQDRFPALQRNAICILEQRTRELERSFCEVSTRKATPRLAQSLLHLLDQIGHKVNGHAEIHITRESLGQMTAMRAATVSRVLSKWEKQGFVSLRRDAIEVHDASGLSDACKVGTLPRSAS
jgi:CRP-like cAMP-binding protein